MNISESVISRKGARSPKEVPQEILNLLNAGHIATVNLSEWLAVDQKALLSNTFENLGYAKLIPEFLETLDGLKKQTATQLIRAIGQLIVDSENIADREQLIASLATHLSDSVRCWAAYAIGLNAELEISAKFKTIAPYAADSHFGVREIAWLATRDSIIAHLPATLELLRGWTLSEDENIRRFASEATRPRGVWCPHIDQLKKAPQQALPVLEPLKSDPSKYVRDSVGNWLNDASKNHPEWVTEVCNDWTTQSPTKETAYIVKRAMRTIAKSGC